MALFKRDKTKDETKAAEAPKRLIPEDSLPELAKVFEKLSEPVSMLVFTDPGRNVPYNTFMETLCRELTEISPKLTLRVLDLGSDEARLYGVDFSPTLLLAPDRCRIRYLGAPLGEEGRTLIETLLRLSAGKSGLSKTTRSLLAELGEERRVTVFVNPACPYCPGQVSNVFRCAIERPDLVSAVCVDTTQHPELAAKHQVGSVPHTTINDTLTTLGLQPEERFAIELVTLKKAEDLLEAHHAAHDAGEGQEVQEVDVVVAGAGPAGLTAAMYAARSGLSAVVLEKNVIGGQVAITPVVENYPGFANVPGKRLMEMIADQARAYAPIHEGEAIDEVKVGRHIEVYTGKAVYVPKALILATGASWRKLGVPGEERYFGFGVSYCSTCDGYLYRGKKAVVVGGGNTAVTDALHLKNLGVDVTLVHRREALRAEKHLQDALAKAEVPTVLGAVVEEIVGGEDGKVAAARVKILADGSVRDIPTDAVFVAIGLNPNTALAEQLGLTLDANGYIQTDRGKRTSIPRIYAAGDVTGGSQQIVNAVGDGSTAALSIFEDLAHPYWKKDTSA